LLFERRQRSEINTDRKKKLTQAQNFMVFYGKDNKQSFDGFDIIVIEPSAYDDIKIKQMQSRSLVLGYLSILEIPPWSDILRFMEADDFLQVNGERIVNQEYGNYCADLRSVRWQGILMNKASQLLGYRSFDGLFIDTIGFLEDDQLTAEKRQEQIKAVSELLRKMRAVFPDHVLIQNCGLFEVIKSTYSLIDGVCWENPPLELQRKWVKVLLDKLSYLHINFNLVVFLLLENINTQSDRYMKATEQAKDRNFLLYHAVNGYTGNQLY